MFCSNCGNKLEDNAKFCPKCGNRIVKFEPSVGVDASDKEKINPKTDSEINKSHTFIIVLMIVFVLIVFILIFACIVKNHSLLNEPKQDIISEEINAESVVENSNEISTTNQNTEKQEDVDAAASNLNTDGDENVKRKWVNTHITQYLVAEGDINNVTAIYTTELNYDKDGNLVLMENGYIEDGNNVHTEKDEFEYLYDSNGQILEKKQLHNDVYEVYSEKFEYEYDGSKLKKELYYYGYEPEYGLDHFTEYEYDADSRLIKEYYTNVFDYYTKTYTYEYDDRGNLVKKISNDMILAEYFYNEQNQLVTMVNYGVSQVEEYEYDAIGNLSKKTVYNKDEKIISYEEYEWKELN